MVVRSIDGRRFLINLDDRQYRRGLLGMGNYEPAEGAEADAFLYLSPPLSAWRLEYFVPKRFAES